MTDDSRRTGIRQEVEKGTRALRAGDELLKLDLFDDAVTRFYYAVFHFACAALLVEGVEATSHQGVLTLFSQHLVRSGKLAAARAKDIKRLQGFREAADYDRAFTFTREGASEEADVARGFVGEVQAFLTSGGWLI